MRIFVIHSFSDKEIIKNNFINPINNNTTGTEIIMLDKGVKIWKNRARRWIKKANLVICFVGEDSYNSKNIEWEIKAAHSFNKVIIPVRLAPNYRLPEELYTDNEEMTLQEVIEYIHSYMDGDYSLFNDMNLDTDSSDFEKNKEYLFEQYKLFLGTSEALVSRRQSVSNFFISVNAAILAVFSAVLALLDNADWKIIIYLGFPITGIILCNSWKNLLRSYGDLNAAKMKIISMIEKRFPASIYDAEWRAQSDRLNLRPYTPFTDAEMRVPKLFIALYSFLIVGCVAFFLYRLFFN